MEIGQRVRIIGDFTFKDQIGTVKDVGRDWVIIRLEGDPETVGHMMNSVDVIYESL